jgi:hypothetical protein
VSNAVQAPSGERAVLRVQLYREEPAILRAEK